MSFLTLRNVSLCGVSACVPKDTEKVTDTSVFSLIEDAAKFNTSTGVECRRISNKDTTTSDLCFYAAEKIIADLKWERESIECLVLVTQTPDYILPATSCILQKRLRLNTECYAIDISLGCSGWVYGMSVISTLISSGNFKRGLLLVGDTLSKICSKKDKSTYPLFGDAGTATALEYNSQAKAMEFHLATDGSGYDSIIIPDGGYRNQVSQGSFYIKKMEDGIQRDNLSLVLNGMDVFSFGLSKAPQSINKLLGNIGIDKDYIDYFFFHQANKFMNEQIRKKLKLSQERVPYSLKEFGNTSSASIPLTMICGMKEKWADAPLKIMTCGFGVGLSWGSLYFETEKIICSQLIEI
jgi:3-oxoacyl-[acyl-carrier-protein] synthase III